MELTNFYVKVTEENKLLLSKWRWGNDTSHRLAIDEIVGMVISNKKLEKGHNGAGMIKDYTYDFGNEISFEEFRKYILKRKNNRFNI